MTEQEKNEEAYRWFSLFEAILTHEYASRVTIDQLYVALMDRIAEYKKLCKPGD